VEYLHQTEGFFTLRRHDGVIVALSADHSHFAPFVRASADALWTVSSSSTSRGTSCAAVHLGGYFHFEEADVCR